jgi:hypothetical protein
MAETVEQLGYGGASAAQDKLGWNRGTIRKGEKELKNGPIQDCFSERGCKKSEELLPNLLEDIKKIVEPECQTDPSFNTCRLYTRITAKASFRSFIGSYSPVYPSSGSSHEFLQAPLPSSTYSLLSGLWLDFHQLVRDHAGRTTAISIRSSLIPD